jgi:hypothetical protein
MESKTKKEIKVENKLFGKRKGTCMRKEDNSGKEVRKEHDQSTNVSKYIRYTCENIIMKPIIL